MSLVFCSKGDSVDQSDCSNTFNLLIDKDWFPSETNTDTLAVIRFNSNGDYSENEIHANTWEIEGDCNLILFFIADLQSLDFQYEVISISSNTLKIRNPSEEILTYHTLSYLIG